MRLKGPACLCFGGEMPEWTDGRHVHISAPSRDWLAQHLAVNSGMTLQACCGREYRFIWPIDLPEHTMHCECGDRQCVIMEYRDE